MPLFKNEKDTEWYSDQLRSEIKRLKDLLQNTNLTTNERAVAQAQLTNYLAETKTRRSTRVPVPVRLKIFGQNRVGTPQTELTSALAVNCHGCLCLSRHEYLRNSWMTLEVSNLHTGHKSAPVRAKVRFVRLPGNPRELYHLGVELEKPANIWGIKSVPEDWRPFLDSASVSGGVVAAAEIRTGAQTEQVKCIPAHPKELEASALVSLTPQSSRCHNQESIVKTTDSLRDCDNILIPGRVGFLSRLNNELADAGDRLFEWAAAFVTRTRTMPQSLDGENGVEEIQTAQTKGKAFSKKLVSGQVSVRAGKDVRYWIKIDTSKMVEPTVTGWFRASGGSPSDIALVLATEQEFENLIHGREARVLFAIDSIKSGEFQISIAQSGTYILAFNNRFSIFMPRTFTGKIDLHYSNPSQARN